MEIVRKACSISYLDFHPLRVSLPLLSNFHHSILRHRSIDGDDGFCDMRVFALPFRL